jgi:hypothetical protein
MNNPQIYFVQYELKDVHFDFDLFFFELEVQLNNLLNKIYQDLQVLEKLLYKK